MYGSSATRATMESASLFAWRICHQLTSAPEQSYAILAERCLMVDPAFDFTGLSPSDVSVNAAISELGRRGGIASVETHGDQMRNGGLAGRHQHLTRAADSNSTHVCVPFTSQRGAYGPGCGRRCTPSANVIRNACVHRGAGMALCGRFVCISCRVHPCNC